MCCQTSGQIVCKPYQRVHPSIFFSRWFPFRVTGSYQRVTQLKSKMSTDLIWVLTLVSFSYNTTSRYTLCLKVPHDYTHVQKVVSCFKDTNYHTNAIIDCCWCSLSRGGRGWGLVAKGPWPSPAPSRSHHCVLLVKQQLQFSPVPLYLTTWQPECLFLQACNHNVSVI